MIVEGCIQSADERHIQYECVSSVSWHSVGRDLQEAHGSNQDSSSKEHCKPVVCVPAVRKLDCELSVGRYPLSYRPTESSRRSEGGYRRFISRVASRN